MSEELKSATVILNAAASVLNGMSSDLHHIATLIENIEDVDPLPIYQPMGIDIMYQRDPRWANEYLGHSKLTIGGWGCALTCAAMLGSQYDSNITPLSLQERIKPHNGFSGAYLNWKAVSTVVPELDYNGTINWQNAAADMKSVRLHLKSYPVILWVDAKPGGIQNSHFVVAVDYDEDKDDVLIIDPYDGSMVWLLQRYGLPGTQLARWIYGMRLLVPADRDSVPYVAHAPVTAFFDTWFNEKASYRKELIHRLWSKLWK